MFDAERHTFRDIFPLCTFNTFRTADGVWVQLLGLELPRHLKRTLKACGVPLLPTLARAALTYAREVRPDSEPIKMLRFRPLFRVFNRTIAAGVGRFEWPELKARFVKHGVWHAILDATADARLGAVGGHLRRYGPGEDARRLWLRPIAHE